MANLFDDMLNYTMDPPIDPCLYAQSADMVHKALSDSLAYFNMRALKGLRGSLNEDEKNIRRSIAVALSAITGQVVLGSLGDKDTVRDGIRLAESRT